MWFTGWMDRAMWAAWGGSNATKDKGMSHFGENTVNSVEREGASKMELKISTGFDSAQHYNPMA